MYAPQHFRESLIEALALRSESRRFFGMNDWNGPIVAALLTHLILDGDVPECQAHLETPGFAAGDDGSLRARFVQLHRQIACELLLGRPIDASLERLQRLQEPILAAFADDADDSSAAHEASMALALHTGDPAALAHHREQRLRLPLCWPADGHFSLEVLHMTANPTAVPPVDILGFLTSRAAHNAVGDISVCTWLACLARSLDLSGNASRSDLRNHLLSSFKGLTEGLSYDPKDNRTRVQYTEPTWQVSAAGGAEVLTATIELHGTGVLEMPGPFLLGFISRLPAWFDDAFDADLALSDIRGVRSYEHLQALLSSPANAFRVRLVFGDGLRADAARLEPSKSRFATAMEWSRGRFPRLRCRTELEVVDGDGAQAS